MGVKSSSQPAAWAPSPATCSRPFRNGPLILIMARRRNHLEKQYLYEQLKQINMFYNPIEFLRFPTSSWDMMMVLVFMAFLLMNLTLTIGCSLGERCLSSVGEGTQWAWGRCCPQGLWDLTGCGWRCLWNRLGRTRTTPRRNSLRAAKSAPCRGSSDESP